MNRTWTKLTVTSTTEHLDAVCGVMCLMDNGLMIEDYSDFSFSDMYGELVDDTILNADKTEVKVSLFVPEEKPLPEIASFISSGLREAGVPFSLTTENLAEDDWAEGWKKYYKPIHIGRLSVVPAWEDYKAKEGEIIVRMDPGMAFGTGTHETTHLVMTILEKEIKGGERFLDVGCGSGILSICASKLGADFCAAYDIDPVAVAVAKDNIESDGAKNIICGVSDLLSGVDKSAPYTFVVANIVADILLRMLPDLGSILADGAKVILSGIIRERAEEMENALKGLGYRILRTEFENDWTAILAEKE